MKLPADWNQDDQGLEALAGGHNCPPPELVLAASAGVLPEPQQQQIQLHLDTCKLCQILCREFADPELANPTGTETASIFAKIESQIESKQAVSKSIWSWLWKPTLGLALAGAAVTLFVLNTSRQTIQPKTNTNAQVTPKKREHLPVEMAAVKLPLDPAIVWRGPGDAVADPQKAYLAALGSALVPYRANKPEEAAHALAEVEAKFPKSAEAPFYRGVALLLAGRDAEAIPVLEKALPLAPAALRPDVEFYLALAYDHADRTTDASALLRKLCDKPGDRRAQSCAALQKLDP